MDLRSIANQVSNAVNENIPVTVQPSAGSTIGTAYRQVPQYGTSVSGFAQVQALDGDDLKQLENLNIEGDIKTIILRGQLAAVIRPNQKGGDLVIIASPAPQYLWGTWLIVKVLESWPLWTKAAMRLQGGQ